MSIDISYKVGGNAFNASGNAFKTETFPEFIMEIDTTEAGSASDTFVLPTTGSGYNATVEWGDGNEEVISGTPGNVTHVYDSPGTYTITIVENAAGGFPRIYFANGGDKAKLSKIEQWGEIKWTSMDTAFRGCTNVVCEALDAPDLSGATSCYRMFQTCNSLTTIAVTWDVSTITNMGNMFKACSSLESLDVSGWDTSNVTTMAEMFSGCVDLLTLDLDTSWDTSSLELAGLLFGGCASLDSIDVSGWDVSLVTDMASMFEGCTSLAPLDVSNWTPIASLSMDSMFAACAALTTLDVSDWDVGTVTTMASMFDGCVLLETLDVSTWDVGEVTDLNRMFKGCAELITLDVSGWDTADVTDMSYTFKNCTILNVDVSAFDITSLTDATELMYGSAFNQTNYDALLPAWEAYATSNVVFHAGTAEYGAGSPTTARAALVGRSWTITDGGSATIPAFMFEVDTTAAGSASDTFVLPTTGSGFNATVDWGDSSDEVISGTPGNVTHVYDSGGTYTVSITENVADGFPRIYFNNGGDKMKVMDITNWGTNSWVNLTNAFDGCQDMVISATDVPDTSGVTGDKFERAWKDCFSIVSFPLIDTSNATELAFAWEDCAALTSFPLIDTSGVDYFRTTWYRCTGLNAYDFPLVDMSLMTDGLNMFSQVTLSTTSYSNLLIDIEANTVVNNTGANFGNSKYNIAGGVAKQALADDHSWTITDGGAE